MLMATTAVIEGRPVSQYLGVVNNGMLMVAVSGTAVVC